MKRLQPNERIIHENYIWGMVMEMEVEMEKEMVMVPIQNNEFDIVVTLGTEQ